MSSINEFIPVMEVEGEFYKFRRLGIDDIAELLRIGTMLTTEGFQHLQIRLNFLREIGATDSFRNPETGEYDTAKVNNLLMMVTLAFGVQEVKESFYKFVCATLRKTDVEGKVRGEYIKMDELKDPEIFPAFSIAYLSIYLVMHPDFELLKQAMVEGSKIPFFRRSLEEAQELAGKEMQQVLETLQTPPDPTIS